MVLGRILGPKRDKVTGEWRKLHNEELRDLYSSPCIIRIIESSRMRWVGADILLKGSASSWKWEQPNVSRHPVVLAMCPICVHC
jgi:hypothetical protein